MLADFPDFANPPPSAWDSVCDLLYADAALPLPGVERALDPVLSEPQRLFGAMGLTPDPWQSELVSCDATHIMACCSRQSGKSRSASVLAIKEVLTNPKALVLIVSRSLRQSSELMRKVQELWNALSGGKATRSMGKKQRRQFRSLRPECELLGQHLKARGGFDAWVGDAEDYADSVDNLKLSMEFPEGQRIVCLPGNPDTLVSFGGVTLLIIDEAARTPDALYNAVRPFLAATKRVTGREGRLVVLSTPFGKRGWFWEAYKQCDEAEVQGKTPDFKRFKVTAEECPFLSAEWLQKEKDAIGINWYKQEYLVEFVEAMDSVFSYDKVHAMLQDTGEELWTF